MFLRHSLPVYLVNIAVLGLDMTVSISRDWYWDGEEGQFTACSQWGHVSVIEARLGSYVSFSPPPEPPQETESQEDYEEESFEFSERENRANNNNTPDIAKLSQVEYYSTYGKGAGRFSTAWIIKMTPNWKEVWTPEKGGVPLFLLLLFFANFFSLFKA